MNSLLHILQHALGVGDYGDKPSFRNHFVASLGSVDHISCESLVERGLMRRVSMNKELTGGGECFVVTQEGIDHVSRNSPLRPPEQKLTRSQRNYREFLDADSGHSFSEWIRMSRDSAKSSSTSRDRER